MRQQVLLVALLFSTSIVAQEISGIWKGRLVMASTGCFPVYNLEFELSVKDSLVSGTSWHFSDSLNYIKKKLQGTFSAAANRISLQETDIISFRIKEDCVPCMKSYSLTYHKGTGTLITDEQIRGEWFTQTGKASDGKSICEPGTLVLNRQTKASFPASDNKASTLKNKENILVKELKVDSGVVHIEFYDNGQIYGDTISVYINNRTVVFRQMLKAQAVSLSVNIDSKKPVQDVVMVGENLGTIPPNTALMIVTAGNKRYQLYLTTDEKKNALVRFIYEKGAGH